MSIYERYLLSAFYVSDIVVNTSAVTLVNTKEKIPPSRNLHFHGRKKIMEREK